MAARKLTRLSEAKGVIQRDGTLDMRAMTLTMWRSRGDPAMVQGLSELLLDRHASKEVFAGVEFFLPQLLHMILHLEVKWPTDVLQEFCYMVCQVSLHFALQLHWSLQGALQDCQPELENGKLNPQGNVDLFLRCSMLLASLERAVVYGGDMPMIAEVEGEYSSGRITKQQMDLRLREIRQKHAKELVAYGSDEAAQLEGDLLFKRHQRTTTLAKKPWKERHFVLKNRLLLCYRKADNVLKRAIPLNNCTVTEKPHRRHKFYFEVAENNTDRVFHLAAPNEATRAKWVRELTKAAELPPIYKSIALDGAKLTPRQRMRHDWFTAETRFVRGLTDIAEELRGMDPGDRADVLKRRLLQANKNLHGIGEELDLYNPLCKSADHFYKVVAIDYNNSRVFNTRERCPCLIAFETAKPHADDVVDVANFLHDKYGEHRDENTFRDRVKATLAPVLSVSVTKASLWDEEEDVVAGSKLRAEADVGQSKLIAKSHDDVRQEVFIMQLIQFLSETWAAADAALWVKPYRILSTAATTGLIEVVEDSVSLDALKADYRERLGRNVTLLEHFERTFRSAAELRDAQRRFTESLAGYSVACYILGIKDRHNGNIMLRDDGRIVHIDFGFVLGMAPGKDKVRGTNFSLERAPFKLTNEMVSVMGGVDSELYKYFGTLCFEGLLAAREQADTLLGLVEITAFKSSFPCFHQPAGVKRVIKDLEQRLMRGLSIDALEKRVATMVHKARQHKGTVLFEAFQARSNGIRPIY